MWKSSLICSLQRPIRSRLTGVRFFFTNLNRAFRMTVHRKRPMIRDISLSSSFFMFAMGYVQVCWWMAGVDTRDQDDLFRYTSGRWLINEEHQQKQRYITFNISNLCSQAAALFGPGIKCVHIIKLEGNFNKAFLLMIDDGNKVIAKIPCPNAGTPLLIIVSEVATLKFCIFSKFHPLPTCLYPDCLVQSYLSIRVPEVYAWSSNPTNPVGAKYIIMEKIRGIALAER